MGGIFETKQSQKSQIDPNLNKYGTQLLDGMMMGARVDPRQAAFQGPTVAAFSPAQTAAMDASAAASNAFGIPSVSASQGLPQAKTYAGGLTGYSGAEQAMAGMSPAMMQVLNHMWRQGGIMNSGTGAAPTGAPRGAASQMDALMRGIVRGGWG